MADFAIAEVAVGRGVIGLCPMPGGTGDYAADFRSLLRWGASLVVSLMEPSEMSALGVTLGTDLRHAPPDWVNMPIPDYGIPDADTTERWVSLESRIAAQLAAGKRVLFHCKGGCGRSGMIVLRLMVLHGEAPAAALARLRAVRPCAVETQAQLIWATR
ncbi:protein-tyrosine phosphatase family protein [Loktanella sp. DJP18]|uniref:protein-tyrosine phosphatase family protein n=1 Tax=Loktanella sp. DJP18 TaxID=3409788 RepID=UPI003BB4CBEC